MCGVWCDVSRAVYVVCGVYGLECCMCGVCSAFVMCGTCCLCGVWWRVQFVLYAMVCIVCCGVYLLCVLVCVDVFGVCGVCGVVSIL